MRQEIQLKYTIFLLVVLPFTSQCSFTTPLRVLPFIPLISNPFFHQKKHSSKVTSFSSKRKSKYSLSLLFISTSFSNRKSTLLNLLFFLSVKNSKYSPLLQFIAFEHFLTFSFTFLILFLFPHTTHNYIQFSHQPLYIPAAPLLPPNPTSPPTNPTSPQTNPTSPSLWSFLLR